MEQPDRVAQLIARHRGRAATIEQEIPALRAMARAARVLAQETREGARAYQATGEMRDRAKALLARSGANADAADVLEFALCEQAIQIALQIVQRADEFDAAASRLEGERASLVATVAGLSEAP